MVSQFQLLNKILETNDFSVVTTNDLTEDYFFNYKAEFKYIKNHYEQFYKVPDKLTFAAVFPDFEFIDVAEPTNYLLNQIYADYNKAFLASRFNNIKGMLEQDKLTEAIDYFTNSIDGLHKGSAMTCTDLFHDGKRLDHYVDRMLNSTKRRIETGFPELDQIIGGIDMENENLVIAARTGVGKTQVMLKMAAEAASQGKCVGIYEGEMTADKVGYRIDTFISHISNTALNRGEASIKDTYRQYLDYMKTNSNFGTIKVITPTDIAGPVTVDTLRAFVERENIEILFVDQYSLLDDTSHSKTSFERVGNIAKQIKKLQVEKQIPIIAVAQMNRTKNEDGTKDTTQIGLSDMIPQYATILLMLDRKESKTKKGKILEIEIVKARDGGEGNKLEYQVDWDSGSFAYIPNEQDGFTSEEEFEAQINKYEPDELSF